MRVLLVEDDRRIGEGIASGLAMHGISSKHVMTAVKAAEAHREETFHAIVLDLGLPDKDGLEFLDEVRAFEPELPVLVLSARDSVEARVNALHNGADDYLTKPFDLRELAARIHALVRRTMGRTTQAIHAGPLRLEPASGLAWLDGAPVTLSRREVDLLTHLSSNDGRWVLPEVLAERVFGMGSNVGSNTLNVHIHNIRRKLGTGVIETTRGLGYRLGWRDSTGN